MALSDWFAYPTKRMIRVDVWQIGLTFRILQTVIIGAVAYDIFLGHAWAYSEVPSARGLNAWGESTPQFAAVGATQPYYCSNQTATHNYVYSSEFQYVSPACRHLAMEEIVSKSLGAVSFTTSVIESVELGFACSGTDARTVEDTATKFATCAALGAPVTYGGSQCSCSSSETYYVTGVEEIGVAFEHGYSTTKQMDGLAGRSASSEDEVGSSALDTKLRFSNGTERVFAGGENIVISLSELMTLNGQHHTLGSINPGATLDSRGNGHRPTFRVTGMKLTVDLRYSNLQEGGLTGEVAPIKNSNVDATLNVTAETGWAGAGPQVFFPQTPLYGANGTMSYEKMIRYRQGVVVEFKPAGLVYAFDYNHFVNVLIAGFLFLAIAVYVMDFVTFNLLPNGLSKVLYNKRAESVSKVHTFAQVGLRAATAVADFNTLDSDGSGYIEVKDLVSVFGKIPTVSKDQAFKITQTIMRAADKDSSTKGRISFDEFMSLFEGAAGIHFDDYVKLVDTTAEYSIREESKKAAAAAYDKVEADANGIVITDDAKQPQAGGGGGGGAAPEVPRLACFACRTVFGVPPGANMVRCPSCGTTNSAQPAAGQQQQFVPGGPPVQQQQYVPVQQQQIQAQPQAMTGPAQIAPMQQPTQVL